MNVDWEPSKLLLGRAKKVVELRKLGLTYPEIQKLHGFQYDLSYLHALRRLAEKEEDESNNQET